MNKVLSEKDYQQYILQRLSQDNGYRIRPADQFDRLLAMDKELLFTFLQNTQPDTWAALRKIYKERLEENSQIFDFALSDEEMAAITAMDAQQRVAGVPDDMMPYIL